jgi:hypothetical protein
MRPSRCCGTRAAPSPVRLAWADGGYADKLAGWAKKALKLTLIIAGHPDDLHTFQVLPAGGLPSRHWPGPGADALSVTARYTDVGIRPTCCATASGTPASGTGPPSPRTSSRSAPPRRRPRRWTGSPSSAGKWEKRYPAIIRLWESAWAESVPFLAVDREIRSIICTTNAIESLNARLRRSVRARGHFPTVMWNLRPRQAAA